MAGPFEMVRFELNRLEAIFLGDAATWDPEGMELLTLVSTLQKGGSLHRIIQYIKFCLARM